MKSKILVALLAIFIMLPITSTFAETQADFSGKKYLIYYDSVKGYVLVELVSGGYFFVDSFGYLFASSAHKVYYSPTFYGDYKYQFSNNTEKYITDVGTSQLKYSSVDIYINRDKSGVFFSGVPEPPKPLVTISAVEEIPETMSQTLVGGGLLSTGLIVLAILLGVSLVRRFPLWRLR